MKLFSDPRAVLAQRGTRLCDVLVSAESDALQDHCLMMQKNLRLERETYPWGKKTDLKKNDEWGLFPVKCRVPVYSR